MKMTATKLHVDINQKIVLLNFNDTDANTHSVRLY